MIDDLLNDKSYTERLKEYEERRRVREIPMDRILKTSNPYYTAYRLLRRQSIMGGLLPHYGKYELPMQYREKLIQQFAWAIPCPAAISTIAALSPVIEIGAGNGYWGKLVSEAGGDIVCYDKHPYQHAFYNGGVAGAEVINWFEVSKGDETAVLLHPERKTLLLCWPPYKDSMAQKALDYFKGDYLIYVGEADGCTADAVFSDRLDKDWYLYSTQKIPQYEGLRDWMFLYRRAID